MYQNKRPIFKKHTVLKADVLSQGFDENKLFIQKMFMGFSNGIISGMDIDVTENKLKIGTGLILFEQRLYASDEIIWIPYKANRERQYIYIRFLERQEDEEFQTYQTEIFLTTQKQQRFNDLLLAHFELKEGAVLRQNYQCLHDFLTDHNTLNILDMPFAAIGESTFSPVITKYIGQQLMKTQLNTPLDASFALECLQGKTLSYEGIISYIEYRLQKKVSDRNNREQVFKLLCEVVDKAIKGERYGEMVRKQRQIIT